MPVSCRPRPSSAVRAKQKSGLLPQSGGFARVGLVCTGTPPGGLAVTPLNHVPDRLLHWSPAGDRTAAIALTCDGHVSEISNIFNLSLEVWRDAEQVLPPVSDAVVVSVRVAALHLPEARDELNVGVEEREKGIQVSSIEGSAD